MGTFDSATALSMPLSTLQKMMKANGCKQIFTKKLASNDNSKNQIYCAGHLTDLSFIVPKSVESTPSNSNKTKDPKRKVKFIAPLNFAWLTPEGSLLSAPNTKLIYYPQYPEVRLSGFLMGAKGVDVSAWMDRYSKGTAEGRWLVLGVGNENRVVAYLVTPESSLSKELDSIDLVATQSVFHQIIDRKEVGSKTSKNLLLDALTEIHLRGYIPSQKLSVKSGLAEPYKAQNGGGYTLESMLGVLPNGDANPDYLGWEVKQFSVSRFPCVSPSVTTLFTPEPDGGIYTDSGLATFMDLYGYEPANGTANRINFGGIHYFNSICKKTGLELRLSGFDLQANKISEADGFIGLCDKDDRLAASWSFSKLLQHWQRKHSKAVYIPCMKVSDDVQGIGYLYGSEVELGVGTTFEKMLSALADCQIYYDPGIKIENLDADRPKAKKRSQFRIKHSDLSCLYNEYEHVSLR